MSTAPAQPAFDPAELPKLYAEIAQKSSDLLAGALQRAAAGGAAMPADELGLAKAFFDVSSRLFADPFKLAELQMKVWTDYVNLWQGAMMKMMGSQVAPVAEPPKGDRRFRHEAWENNFLFDFVKQSYLIAARHLHGAVAGVDGLDPKTAGKVDFYTRQYIDALAPTNFVMTNPEVLDETVKSGGANLVKGFANLLDDLERGDGQQVRIKMTDASAFRLGENVASTPGKVVYRTDLMQLIQYEPATKNVLARPLVIFPPWINKFYILDLRPKNSFIKWAVDQGHTVFVVSWVNPDRKLAHKNFEDYLTEGTIAALDAVEKATGSDRINAIGYCLGGTLLGASLAWLAAKKDRRVASATFFVTMLDFEHPGELGVFIDETQVASLEKKMHSRGYLEGSEMATTFNMLRSNDLIWSFVVNNYLLGKQPFPFDLLYWNSDSTRMPATMHSFYLRNMYMKNLLRKPGGITLAGVPIDITKVDIPMYFLSTIEDHIAPWKSTYAGAKLFKGPVRFTLAGSGHIAGVINPPTDNKYCHWTGDRLPATPDEWFASAQQHSGSWWSDWHDWVSGLDAAKVPARVPGKGGLGVIEDAPGSYVKMRIDAKKHAARKA
jgi:polyhydroxyalkanoate synthase